MSSDSSVSTESVQKLEEGYKAVPQDAKQESSVKIDPTSTIPLKCWVILFISCMGVLMASVSSTALIIIFPTLLIELDASISTVMYILIMMMLVVAGVVGIAGKLGDIFGQATLYKLGMFVFTLGSFIAGFANKKYQGMVVQYNFENLDELWLQDLICWELVALLDWVVRFYLPTPPLS